MKSTYKGYEIYHVSKTIVIYPQHMCTRNTFFFKEAHIEEYKKQTEKYKRNKEKKRMKNLLWKYLV